MVAMLASMAIGIAGAAHAIAAEDAANVEAAHERLDGSEWLITLTPMSDDGGASETDALSFADRHMTSQRLLADGFPSVRYTIALQGSAMIWESMQQGEQGTMLWRGELRGETDMRGVQSYRRPNGKMVDYSFTGSMTKAAPLQTLVVSETSAVIDDSAQEPHSILEDVIIWANDPTNHPLPEPEVQQEDVASSPEPKAPQKMGWFGF
jgi:hypothetical protein